MSGLFISVSSEHEQFAERIVESAKRMGHTTFFYKENIKLADTWPTAMAEALERTDYIICFVSKSFLTSDFCMDEMAVGYKRKNLIIFKLEDCTLPGQYDAKQNVSLSKELSDHDEEAAIQKFEQAMQGFFSGRQNLLVEDSLPKFGDEQFGVIFASFDQISGTQVQPAKQWLIQLRRELEDFCREQHIIFTPGTTEVKTAQKANDLLTRSNARLVVWGSISPDEIDVNLSIRLPRFQGVSTRNIYVHGVEEKPNPRIGRVNISTFRMYVSDHGDMEYILYVLASIMQFDNGNRNEAIRLLHHAVDIVPAERARKLRADVICLMLGIFHLNTYEKMEFQKSFVSYSQAISFNPNLAIAYCNRATVMLFGNLEDAPWKVYRNALDDYSKAIEINPEYTWAYHNRALLYQRIFFYGLLAENEEYIKVFGPYRGEDDWAKMHELLSKNPLEHWADLPLGSDINVDLDLPE